MPKYEYEIKSGQRVTRKGVIHAVSDEQFRFELGARYNGRVDGNRLSSNKAYHAVSFKKEEV